MRWDGCFSTFLSLGLAVTASTLYLVPFVGTGPGLMVAKDCAVKSQEDGDSKSHQR